MTGKYDDILNLPHHVSATRPQMPMSDRAAQFSPFAALTGYDAAVKETARLTDEQVELSEDRKAILDRKQAYLRDIIMDHPEITVVHFVPDALKKGGGYVTTSGRLKKLDVYEKVMLLEDGTRIPMERIVDLTGDVFYEGI